MATLAFNKKTQLLNRGAMLFCLFLLFHILKNYVFFNLQNLIELFPWRCPWHYFLNISCPGCGMLRSVFYALDLQITKSLQFHILGIPILITGTVCFFNYGLEFKQWINSFDKKLKINPQLSWLIFFGLGYNFITKNWALVF